MITKLLSTAVKLYLRSQVSQAEDLRVKIGGKNRQILKGYIPHVFLSCKRGVYRGLHLREVEINGNDIAVNLPEVLKNKPLELLEPIIVKIKLGLDANDLLNSLDSNLLQSGLTDLWKIILKADRESLVNSQPSEQIEWNNIAIGDRELTFSGTYQDSSGRVKQLNLFTQVSLSNDRTLCLSSLKISNDSDTADKIVNELEIYLGQDVKLDILTIASGKILCLGKITVNN